MGEHGEAVIDGAGSGITSGYAFLLWGSVKLRTTKV